VIVGEEETFAGASGFMRSHGVEIVNVNSEECKVLMREFIRQNPELWNEDIGK
jgi:cytosine deaminase